ncbi:MAG: hypothetical protein IPG17_32915 [Sandaracinaceae bacterium]|jgi:hypothetical protein|nr:hypothetical protein [Sandaracinaceae bacterium]MBK6808198.1 hypothetical protein [Sandaracinaceae bacterium]MBK7151855.1 hypothetical protein [Sandaracinaceae bacterium]MBK7778981.1 hypothetical protein [Sandaracinaceae bacterium]MBK8411516.1 hypothetical protein [Sandaracinaceae bacterium]
MEHPKPALERAQEAGKNAAKKGFAVFKAELRFVLAAFFRPFWKTLGVVAVLVFLFITYAAISGLADDPATDTSVYVVLPFFALFYALVVGAPVAAIVAAFRAAWTLSGPWVLVPIFSIPLALLCSFWLMSGPLASAATGVLDACVAAGRGHHWLVADMGRIAHVGPVALVVLLPLLVIDLGAIAFSSAVLGALAWLLIMFSLAFLLGLVPAGLVSFIAVSVGYVRRFRRRHAP